MSGEVHALFWKEKVADIVDGVEEMIEGSGTGAFEVGLELGKSHFDRVEVGVAGRQEQDPAAPDLPGLRGAGAFVGGEIVEDDKGAGFQGRGKLGLDVSVSNAIRSMAP